MKHSQILQWKQPHLVELVLGQQNHLWIQRGRASARSLWISHGGRRARGGKRREREGKGEERKREVEEVEGGYQARPATMTSRAFNRE